MSLSTDVTSDRDSHHVRRYVCVRRCGGRHMVQEWCMTNGVIAQGVKELEDKHSRTPYCIRHVHRTASAPETEGCKRMTSRLAHRAAIQMRSLHIPVLLTSASDRFQVQYARPDRNSLPFHSPVAPSRLPLRFFVSVYDRSKSVLTGIVMMSDAMCGIAVWCRYGA